MSIKRELNRIMMNMQKIKIICRSDYCPQFINHFSFIEFYARILPEFLTVLYENYMFQSLVNPVGTM